MEFAAQVCMDFGLLYYFNDTTAQLIYNSFIIIHVCKLRFVAKCIVAHRYQHRTDSI